MGRRMYSGQLRWEGGTGEEQGKPILPFLSLGNQKRKEEPLSSVGEAPPSWLTMQSLQIPVC